MYVCMYVCMYISPNKSASFRHFRLGSLKELDKTVTLIWLKSSTSYKLIVGKVAKSPSFLIVFAVGYASAEPKRGYQVRRE